VVNRSQGADNRPRLGLTVAQLWRGKLPAIVTAHVCGWSVQPGRPRRTHDPSLRERRRVYAKRVIAIVAKHSPVDANPRHPLVAAIAIARLGDWNGRSDRCGCPSRATSLFVENEPRRRRGATDAG
jgi:hypothetical protein